MEIRTETPEDIEAIRQVNVAAFGRENEADLVDRLRGGPSTFSFVALTQPSPEEISSGQIIGHIFYSPVAIAEGTSDRGLMLGLAPMAVLPEYQRQGVGAQLIRHSLAACAREGCQAVVVVGHPEYYPKFGFVPAKAYGLRCEYAVPDEVFMGLELTQGALAGCRGTVRYRSEFSTVE